jgi:hypothetical protein
MVYMARSSEVYGYTKGKLCGVVKSLAERRENGRMCIALCSVHMPGFEIIRGNIHQLWFNVYSASTAYDNGLKASQKDRGFGMFENLYMERNSAMKYTGVSGSIVV